MNTNKRSVLLLTTTFILLLVFFMGVYFFRQRDHQDQLLKVKQLQISLDSAQLILEASGYKLDTLARNFKHSLESARQLDEQVKQLSADYEKRRTVSRKSLDSLVRQAERNHQSLQSLQHELEQL